MLITQFLLQSSWQNILLYPGNDRFPAIFNGYFDESVEGVDQEEEINERRLLEEEEKKSRRKKQRGGRASGR